MTNVLIVRKLNILILISLFEIAPVAAKCKTCRFIVSSKRGFYIKGKFYLFIILSNESQIRIPVLFFGKNNFVTDAVCKL